MEDRGGSLQLERVLLAKVVLPSLSAWRVRMAARRASSLQKAFRLCFLRDLIVVNVVCTANLKIAVRWGIVFLNFGRFEFCIVLFIVLKLLVFFLFEGFFKWC